MKNPALLLLLFLAWNLTSCSTQDTPLSTDADSFFEGYIQAHTHGMIPSSDPVIILLKQSVQGYQPGDQLPGNLIEMTPGVKGKSFLTESAKVEFYPDEPLRNAKDYKVQFRIGELFNLPEKYEQFTFSVSVVPLDFRVEGGQLLLENDNSDRYRYEGKIYCSDRMNLSDLQSVFSLRNAPGDPDFQVEELADGYYRYQITGLVRQESKTTLSLVWNAKKIGLDTKGELLIDIPGKQDFVILGVDAIQGEDQLIRVVFSGELDQDQNLQGMIYLEGTDDYRMQIAKQEVTLYPQTRLEGELILKVEAGVKSLAGKTLGESESFELLLSPHAPEIQFLGNGYILPDAGGLFLPFKSVGLKAVDVYVYKIYANNIHQFLQQNYPENSYSLSGSLKYVGRPVFRKTLRLDQDPSIDLRSWNSFSIDLSSLVGDDPHAFYHVELRIRQEFASYDCGDNKSRQSSPLKALPEKFSKEDLRGYDDAEYYWEDLYPQEYDWREQDNPCHVSYYNPSRFQHRNVLATNLGIVAKSANQKEFLVAVTDLLTASPVSNASVQFYNFQQQEIVAGVSGSNGLLSITVPEVPWLIEVTSGEQKAYLKVDEGSSLTVSNFDVSGEEVEGGIKGLIYGERGVWRPGDTLNISFVLFDPLDKFPADLPVILQVFNPLDQLVYNRPAERSLNGFYYFPVPTHPDDPTGKWKAVVQAGGVTFDKVLRIENIRPNRLKMTLTFNRDPLISADPGQKLLFAAQWLHGAPAAGMRTEVRLKLVDQPMGFNEHTGFVFHDPLKQYWPDEFVVFDELLDQSGRMEMPVSYTAASSAPGMLKAVFTSRVFEKGGGFSTDVYTIPFSPYQRYVGVSVPGLNDKGDALQTDSLHEVKVVSVNPAGQLAVGSFLNVKVYKLHWSWWWSTREDDLASYIGSEYEKLVYETSLQTTGGKGTFHFKVDYPDWGRYLIHVSDPEGGHSTGQVVYMDWPAWVNRAGRQNPSGATMLTFSADKEEYAPGDKAVLTFPGLEGGRALVTMESGASVLSAEWIDTEAPETTVDVKITPEMAPNVYAAITLVQPHQHEGNDLPVRQYGVLRINVADPDSRLQPRIEVPQEIRPNSSFSIRVSEADGKPMTYTLAIVDEGLLNLTRFRAPDPWEKFYAREALRMKTWDYFDQVIGAYGGRIEGLLAIGGDEGELNDDARKAERFPPVATFLGPFELKKGRTKVHDLEMSNYVGEVRAMVLAGSGRAWGSAEARALVRQPLMVLSGLPRKLSPEETVELPVSLFVMKDLPGKVTVRVETEGPVVCADLKEQQLDHPVVGEHMLYFKIRAGEQTGLAKIRVVAVSREEKAVHETEIDVLNPNPYIYTSQDHLIGQGEEIVIPVQFDGSTGTNSASLTISGLPSIDLQENLDYLISYPYGCLEQIVSSAIVQIVLGDLVDLPEPDAIQADANVRDVIRRLNGFQLPSGGFSLWPGTPGAHLWATSYAGHLMVLAERKGYVIPASVKDKWMRFQRSKATSWTKRSDDPADTDLQQAYRLYTLALAGQPELPAMNRLRESVVAGSAALWRLAAAYKICGRQDVAEQLILSSSVEQNDYNSTYNPTFGSTLRDQAMMLETLLLLKQSTQAFSLAKKVASHLKGERQSTQTTAYCLLSLSGLSEYGYEAGESLRFSWEMNGEKENISTQKLSWLREIREKDRDKQLKIVNRGEGPIFVQFTAYGQAESDANESLASGITLECRYTDLAGNSIDPSLIRQGTTFFAEAVIKNPTVNGHLEHLALTQSFPSGWEIISTRYNEEDFSEEESSYAFRDIKDDRVHTFFSLQGGRQAVFRIRLNAAWVGEFYMPAPICHDMYRLDIMASGESRMIEVSGSR